MTEKSNNFITVLTVSYLHETAIIRGRLESEGIECNLLDELTVQVNPLYSDAIGGIKLQVRESDFDKAIEILKDGGYLKDGDLERSVPKLLMFFERTTAKIPILKNVRFEVRVMIIVTILVGLAATIFHFATLPSTTERLLGNNWCIENISYNDNNYTPKTLRFISVSGGGFCAEKISFNEVGRLSLPGFNSKRVNGQWEVYDNFLELTKADTFEFVYNGKYEINFSASHLILKSETTTIKCTPERMYY